MKGHDSVYVSLHKFRVDSLKTLQEAITKHFGDVYSHPDLGTKFTLFKKTVMKGLEKHYIEWEMGIRKEYKDYTPQSKRNIRRIWMGVMQLIFMAISSMRTKRRKNEKEI